ncbi:MAG: protein TolQ [Alphaproteobacteria bacterium]|nr:protein TolQ [Alphaproteobacteria bacterium]
MPTSSTSLPDLNGIAIAAETVTHNLSIWGLFMSADPVVKLVMIGLLFASFWSWAIIFNKAMRIKTLFSTAAQFEDSFWSGGSLDVLYERMGNRPRDPMSAVFAAAMREWKRMGTNARSSITLQERIERAMHVTVTREMDKLDRHMGFLASLGSTATFVGLFGTVWGIMNSFIAISSSQNTSLAVVAPGIAEALIATAIGLVAAIPAVVAYQKLSLELNRYANRLDSFASEFGTIISRQLEESH